MPPTVRKRDWLGALAVLGGGVGVLMLWRSAWILLAWHLSGLHLDLASFAQRRHGLEAWVAAAPFQHGLMVSGVYALVCALCLPGTLTLVVVAGALFGWWRGTLWVLPAAVLGSTVAFSLSRHTAGAWVRRAFPEVMAVIDAGLAQGGDWYVLTVRMLPVSSFSLVNLGLGATNISTGRFMVLSGVGLLPGTLAYAWAGQNLGELHRVQDLLSPQLWFALAALAMVPVGARFLKWLRR